MGAQLQGRSRAGKRGYRPMSEINVTPFVDVMLVLLVVFMITAPLLTAGVKIELPKTEAASLSTEDNKPLEIIMDSRARIYVGSELVKKDKLSVLLTAIAKEDASKLIYVRADAGLSYGEVMKVMAMVNTSGFSKVALISEPVSGVK